MATCPACRKGKLVKFEDTRYCSENCGFVEDIKPIRAQKWLLKIAENDKNYWRREYFDKLPTFIAHEYRRLWLMTRRPNVFCMVYQLKDVGEVLMKFPVLCAAAYLDNDEVSGKLVEKALSIGDWQRICQYIIGEYGGKPRFELPECLRNILTGIHQVYCDTNIANYRNDYLGHGAMGFEDNQGYRDFGEKLINAISSYLANVLPDYARLKVTVDGTEFTGWRVPKGFSTKAEPVLHIEGREIPLYPYMANSEKHGILFFDYYKATQNNQLANGLNYVRGGGRKTFVAPYYCEVYGRQFGDAIQKGASGMDMTTEDSVSTPEIEKVLSELNEADNFVRPEYLINWLGGKLKDDKGSVQLLMMERGMGKTAFSYAAASGTVKYDGVFACAYYAGQTGMRSDFISGINTALSTDLVQVQEGPDKFVLLERNAEDKPASLLASLRYFRDKHAEKHGKPKLLLILDGVDELPQESAGLFEYLPNPDELPDNVYILITTRNPQSEKLSPHITRALEAVQVSDTLRVYASMKGENGKENHEVLKTYATTKVKVLDGGKMRGLTKKEADEMLTRCGGTFLHLKLYAKLAESGIPVKDLPALDSQPLFERYLNEIKKYYGDKLFDEAMTVLYAIVTAEEALTLREAAWLSGDEFVTPKLLSFLRDFGALLKTTRETGRGSLLSPASERYREYVEAMFPEKKAELAAIFTDKLMHTDPEQYKDANGNYALPDGLFYMAAYLPTVTDEISEELRDRVYKDIDRCVMNRKEPHILLRRAKMGKVWQDCCCKAGWYSQQIGFLNITGNSYSTLCEHDQALEWKNKQVALCKQFLSEGKLDDENRLATAYINRGVTYQTIGKYDEALRDYRECIRIMEDLQAKGRLYAPNDLAKAYQNRGNALLSTGKYDEALRDYGEGIRIMEELQAKGRLYNPNDLAGAYMNRGVTYSSTGKYDDALRDYGEGIRIREDLQAKGRLYDPNDLAKAYMNRGGTYWSTGNYDDALRDYGEGIRIMEDLQAKGRLYDPNDLASAYMNRGVTYNDIGNYDDALRDYGECIRIREDLQAKGRLYDPNDLAIAYLNRGNAYWSTDQYGEALRDYGECIRIMEDLQAKGRLYDPNDLATAYMNRGVTYRATGKYDEALRDYGECIRIREDLQAKGGLYDWQYDLGSAWFNKGILLATGLNDTDGALEIINHAIRVLEAEGKLSYNANDTLEKLREVRNILTGK